MRRVRINVDDEVHVLGGLEVDSLVVGLKLKVPILERYICREQVMIFFGHFLKTSQDLKYFAQ